MDACWPLVEVLAEPRRRELYAAVRAASRPLTRDEAADAVGIGRPLAAFHLDKLAEAGLLTVSYARDEGRGGPGAGRPAKRYAAGSERVELSVPARRDDLVGRILAEAVSAGGDVRTHVDEIADRRGREEGRRCRAAGGGAGRSAEGGGAGLSAATEALAELGYEPVRTDDGTVLLRNCPFHRVLDTAPELVCGLNLAYLSGMLDGLEVADDVAAELRPGVAGCCVALMAATDEAQPRSRED